ncbi:MAG: STAS domain-containing protein [Gammaproteobacteria bacterium]|nr:STAS domain-containing protein [Gammaproteobacteria bacterium]
MNVEIDRNDARSVLHLKEERIDAHNAGELKDWLLNSLEDGCPLLIVDLASVHFIDSSGLGALLSGYKNANLRQARFVLTGLQARVRSMFELTRLHRVFEIAEQVGDVAISR